MVITPFLTLGQYLVEAQNTLYLSPNVDELRIILPKIVVWCLVRSATVEVIFNFYCGLDLLETTERTNGERVAYTVNCRPPHRILYRISELRIPQQ